MKQKTILSLEQALTLPYATQRFVHLGWRVIRIETTVGGGDPNRYIGNDTGIDDLHSYFIAPNVGKEAITLNLKMEKGRQLLKTLIRELDVDVFLCNTLPIRYKQLGIDFDTLKEAHPDLIWCGISALGPDEPDLAGYDPALQARFGIMELTGDAKGDPMLCGLPIVDLKAGDEAFTQVILAMLEHTENKTEVSEGANKIRGKEIFISMGRCMTSWLITVLPELVLNPDEKDKFTRSGNEHRSFIPCNCYSTKDGYVYLAIGNDLQWDKLTHIKGFEHIAKPERVRNAGRKADKDNIYADIRLGMKLYTTEEFLKIGMENNLAIAPVNNAYDVSKLDFVKKYTLKTELPTGEEVGLFPSPMSTEYLDNMNQKLKLAPRLGEYNEKIFTEIGLSQEEIDVLRGEGVI